MEPIEDVLRVRCEMLEDGRMICHVEIKGVAEFTMDNLKAVHGEQVDSSFYGSREFMLRATDWQAGKTMSCTDYDGEVLMCRSSVER